MKQNRPSLKDVVRSPTVAAFIDRGEVGDPASEATPGVLLSLAIPDELYQALRVAVESRGITMEEAAREMVMDFLMKGPE